MTEFPHRLPGCRTLFVFILAFTLPACGRERARFAVSENVRADIHAFVAGRRQSIIPGEMLWFAVATDSVAPDHYTLILLTYDFYTDSCAAVIETAPEEIWIEDGMRIPIYRTSSREWLRVAGRGDRWEPPCAPMHTGGAFHFMIEGDSVRSAHADL